MFMNYLGFYFSIAEGIISAHDFRSGKSIVSIIRGNRNGLYF